MYEACQCAWRIAQYDQPPSLTMPVSVHWFLIPSITGVLRTAVKPGSLHGLPVGCTNHYITCSSYNEVSYIGTIEVG